jgi:hypothetical protein
MELITMKNAAIILRGRSRGPERMRTSEILNSVACDHPKYEGRMVCAAKDRSVFL